MHRVGGEHCFKNAPRVVVVVEGGLLDLISVGLCVRSNAVSLWSTCSGSAEQTPMPCPTGERIHSIKTKRDIEKRQRRKE